MFKDRLFASSTIVGLLYGIAFIVGTVYIPIFIQGVTGGTATNSGLILLPMMLGVVVSAQSGAMTAARFGYRPVMLVFAVIFLIGIYLLSTVTADTTRTTVTIYMVIIGLGTGASFSVLNMAAIHHIGPEQRGSATSTVSFVRQLGMTVGITIYGIIQRNVFTDRLKETFGSTGQMFQGSAGADPRALLSEQARAQIPKPILEKIIGDLANSIGYTFGWALIPAILVLIFAFFLTNERISQVHRPVKKDTAAEAGT